MWNITNHLVLLVRLDLVLESLEQTVDTSHDLVHGRVPQGCVVVLNATWGRLLKQVRKLNQPI